MTLITLPREVLTYHIIFRLPSAATKAIRSVTTGLRDLLDEAAEISYSDLTLAQKDRSYTPGSVQKLCLYLQKRRIIERDSTLFVKIEKVRSDTVTAGGNADEVKDLILHGGKKIGWLAPSLVVFDYESKQFNTNGSYGLGAALSVAIIMEDEEIIEAVFLHPNVQDMKLDNFGIILCLEKALESENPEVLKRIVALPETKKIKPNFGTDSVGSFVCRATQTNDIDKVKTILSIPKAKDIQVRFLQESLITAVKNDNAEIVTILLAQPNASKINPSALDSAIRQATGPKKDAVIDAIVTGTPPDKLSQLQAVRELQSTQE